MTVTEVPPIVRIATVAHYLGVSKRTIYRMVNNGDFPRPILLGAATSKNAPKGWRGQDVADWINTRPSA